MKKIIALTAILLPVVFAACVQNVNSDSDPKTILSKFFKALSNKDITFARKLATQDSQFLLDGLEHEIKSNKNFKAKEKFGKDNLDIGQVTVEGEQARVPVTEKSKESKRYFLLKKENNIWKVQLNRGEMLIDSFEQLMEEGFNPADSIMKAMQELRQMHNDTLKNKLRTRYKK